MWKTIEQFPNFEINESGVVRNARTHYVTTQRMNRKGYLYVQLNDGEKNHCCLVHRLVAETFIPNPENLPIVNHIDECCVYTILWITLNGFLIKVIPTMELETNGSCVNVKYQ